MDSHDKNPTSTHVVNNHWKRRLREFNSKTFDTKQLSRQDKIQGRGWMEFGFSGNIARLHHSQRSNFLKEVYV